MNIFQNNFLKFGKVPGGYKDSIKGHFLLKNQKLEGETLTEFDFCTGVRKV